MKKGPLCGAFLLLVLSTMLAATGCGLAITADDSYITSEQSVRIMDFVIVGLCLAIAIQPLGLWLVWRAAPNKRLLVGRIIAWWVIFFASDVIAFLGWTWFANALIQPLFRRFTRS